MRKCIVGPVLALGLALPLAAQAPREGRSEVELPLATYDALRDAAKEKKEERKEEPWSSARLLRATLSVDLAARRALWEVEIAARAHGDEPPGVPLLSGATAVGRSTVTPEGAALRSDGERTALVPAQAGSWRVVLAGEITGHGVDEAAGIRFALPPLASTPAAFDVTVPADALTSVEGDGVLTPGAARGAARTGRVTLEPEGEATLVVSRARRAPPGPPSVDVALHTVVRLTEATVRTEVRLALAVRKGTLAERRIVLPPGSLVSVSGSVLVDGPSPDGSAFLRLEPPVPAGSTATLVLALVRPRDPAESSFTPALPRLELSPTDRSESELTVVSEGGLLLTPSGDADWAPRASMEGVRVGPDETALGFLARATEPKGPHFAIRRLRALAVASALTRVTLTAFVGETGETRTRLVADVRSRGRTVLRFRVDPAARLLAARVGGLAAAASRPVPELLEIPMDSGSGRTRVELLLDGKGEPPRAGGKLTVAAAGPHDEPVERVTWQLVLPPGLAVKEEPKRLAPLGEPPAPPARAREEAPPAERAAEQEALRIAAEDRKTKRDGSWSPRADLPAAPVAYVTEIADVEGEIPPLAVTVVEKKEKSPWF